MDLSTLTQFLDVLPPWVTKALSVVAVLGALASFLAARVNSVERAYRTRGEVAPRWVHVLGIWLNGVAMNDDKVREHTVRLKAPSKKVEPAP